MTDDTVLALLSARVVAELAANEPNAVILDRLAESLA